MDIIYLVGWIPNPPDQIIINIKNKKPNKLPTPPTRDSPLSPFSSFHFLKISFLILNPYEKRWKNGNRSHQFPSIEKHHCLLQRIFHTTSSSTPSLSLSLSLRPLGTRRRRWRSDRHGWGRWHEQLAKGGDRSSWGVLGRALKRSDLTLMCHRLPHSLRSLTLSCHRHHFPTHNRTQAVASSRSRVWDI